MVIMKINGMYDLTVCIQILCTVKASKYHFKVIKTTMPEGGIQ